jgi:hypothetical protein
MDYEWNVTYTLEDMTVFNRVARKVYYRRVLSAVIRLVGLVVGMLALFTGGMLLSAEEWFQAAQGLVLGALLLVLVLFSDQLSARLSHWLLMKGTGTIRVTLDADGLREESAKGTAAYPYSAFIGCYHCRGRYLLFLDKKHGIILSQTALAAGDPAGLGDYLTQRLGKEIQEIH